MDARARIHQVSDELFAAWNRHDADAVLYAEDAAVVDVTAGITMRGRESIRELAHDRLVAFPDHALERLSLLIDGTRSADRWRMRGTQQGEYQGLPPSGRVVDVAGATFTDYDAHGLVVCDRHYIDVPALLRQLGLG